MAWVPALGYNHSMSPKFAQVRSEALGLTEEERARLAEDLQESLQRDGWPEGLHPAWREEIVRRAREVERGEADLVDGEEALQRLRAKYAG